jgi:hypothetical protein
MDPRVGRFAGADPYPIDTNHPTTLHRYSYAASSPADRVDASGLFFTTFSVAGALSSTLNAISIPMPQLVGFGTTSRRLRLFVRSFAPWREFGLGFGGDNRSFSTDPNATSRVWARITFDPQEMILLEPAHAESDGSDWGPWTDTAVPSLIVRTGIERMDVDLAGANPLVPSADIDIKVRMRVIVRQPDTVCFFGRVEGDAFPNLEVYVEDQRSNAHVLNEFTTAGGQQTGPYLYLPGNNNRPMGDIQQCIQ